MTKLSKTFHKILSPSKGRGEEGFTLIELLVVVAILGVLAGVVTLSVGQFIGTGQTEAERTELHNVQTAVIAYMADVGTVPATTTVVANYGLLIGDLSHGPYTIDQSTGEVTK